MTASPRCGMNYNDASTASLTDNSAPICPMCGIRDSLDALEKEMVLQSDWRIGHVPLSQALVQLDGVSECRGGITQVSRMSGHSSTRTTTDLYGHLM